MKLDPAHPLRHDGLVPAVAAVVPRCSAGPGTEAISIDRRMRDLLARRVRGRVVLSGAPGSGKTTALRHLAAILPADAGVRLIDSAAGQPAPHIGDDRLAIVSACDTDPTDEGASAVLQLAPWALEDCLEYLAARHRAKTAALMRRVLDSPDSPRLAGSPELWRIAMDEMADDDAIGDVRGAILHWLRRHIPAWEAVSSICLNIFANQVEEDERAMIAAAPVLRQRIVQLWLAAQKLAAEIDATRCTTMLRLPLARELVEEAGHLLRPRARAIEHLRRAVEGPDELAHAQAASVLIIADPPWRLADGPSPRLLGASLAGAQWSGIALKNARLTNSDLSRADLENADLLKAVADRAKFAAAFLAGANLNHCHASRADFGAADLTGAQLRSALLLGANFRYARLNNADLSGADLCGADLSAASLLRCHLVDAGMESVNLEGADLTHADLTLARLSDARFAGAVLHKTCFRRAHLEKCDLENIEAPRADFSDARLAGAYLTGSSMPNATFASADLSNTGLADVDWPGVDLRDADLRGASFHLGSTRSGLVGSTIPCEGSKTGFYTDDYGDQDFKAPEEIRKADLQNADLRGAAIDGVDFYLVDLRGAKYTPEQRERFEECGAILGA